MRGIVKETWESVTIGLDNFLENGKSHEVINLSLVLSALQKGIEVAWENPQLAEQILRLNENDMTTQICAILSSA